MRIETNERLYTRNMRVALLANLSGLLLLAASLYVLFKIPQAFGRYLLFLLGGVIFTQIGSYFGRWNKRPDRALNRALKSLDGSYTIYHYRSPVAHLLAGPSGLWILMPRYTRGNISYNTARQRWQVRGARIWSRLVQEGIGRPVQDASLEAEFLDNFLQKNWSGGSLFVHAVLVFVDEETEVQTGDAPIPTVSIKKLNSVIVRGDEKGRLSREQLRQLSQLFESKYK